MLGEDGGTARPGPAFTSYGGSGDDLETLEKREPTAVLLASSLVWRRAHPPWGSAGASGEQLSAPI